MDLDMARWSCGWTEASQAAIQAQWTAWLKAAGLTET